MSGSVDYLVAGEKTGPAKLKKAEKLGIRILSEEEFLRLVAEGPSAADDGTPRPADGNAAGSAPEDGGGTSPDTSGESAPGSSPAAGPAPEDGKDATRPGTVPTDSGEAAATEDQCRKDPGRDPAGRTVLETEKTRIPCKNPNSPAWGPR